MSDYLGFALKKARQKLKLTQKNASEGICAQSMLSAIENDKYIPNAMLLIKLCKRLNISLDEINLVKNFEIATNHDINTQLNELCNNHAYGELKNFLLDDSVIEQIQTATQLQSYYYYLGVAVYQIDNNLDETKRNLKLSLSSDESKKSNTQKSLALISLGLINAKQGNSTETNRLLKEAVTSLDDLEYEENLNVIYYLAALIYFEFENMNKATLLIEKAIVYITNHNSHYMLANCYYLMACIAKKSGETDKQQEAQGKSSFLNELFGEKLNENL